MRNFCRRGHPTLNMILRLKTSKTDQRLLKMPPWQWRTAEGECKTGVKQPATRRVPATWREETQDAAVRAFEDIENDVRLESAEPHNIFERCHAFMWAADQRLKVSVEGRGAPSALWLRHTRYTAWQERPAALQMEGGWKKTYRLCTLACDSHQLWESTRWEPSVSDESRRLLKFQISAQTFPTNAPWETARWVNETAAKPCEATKSAQWKHMTGIASPEALACDLVFTKVPLKPRVSQCCGGGQLKSHTLGAAW